MPPAATYFGSGVPPAATTVNHLISLGGGERAGLMDLSAVTVLVPTRMAARRIREAAVVECARHNKVLLPPNITTADRFLDPDDPTVANRTVTLLLWSIVLGRVHADDYPALFPAGVPFTGFRQRLAFAETIMRLRGELADADLDLAGVVRRLPADFAERERWEDLASLEAEYLREVVRRNLRDRDVARREGARRPRGPSRIVISDIADVSPLLEIALQCAGAPVDILVFGDEPDFDPWGRPEPSRWEEREIVGTDYDDLLTLIPRPAEAGEILREVMPVQPGNPSDHLAIGLLDTEMKPSLNFALIEVGSRIHDAEGASLTSHWLMVVLQEFGDFVRDPIAETALRLLRLAPVSAWIHSTISEFSLDAALAEADRINETRFPQGFDNLLRWSRENDSLEIGLTSLQKAYQKLSSSSRTEGTRDFLDGIIRAFASTLEQRELTELRAAAEALVVILDELDLSHETEGLPLDDWFELLLVAAKRARLADDPEGVEATGWIELPWVESPHLILAGFNQGLVPEPIPNDAFLTDSLRDRLGLMTSRRRSARDACFLWRLLQQRQNGTGRVDFLIAQSSATGDPKFPSSLLFRCPREQLASRVAHLFREAAPPDPEPAFDADTTWKYRIPAVTPQRQISVTAFASYLRCPFQFYLSRICKLQPFDPAPAQMDATLYGELIHDVLKQLHEVETDRELDRPQIDQVLDEVTQTRFGSDPSVPLIIQIESARQRLYAYAEVQAREMADGWRTHRLEFGFSEYLGRELILKDWILNGRVDRLDFHEGRNQWRVLDYKTSDKALSPQAAHLTKLGKNEEAPAFALIDLPDDAGRIQSYCWRNLQLPLYRLMLVEAGIEPASIVTGYVNLPKVRAEASVAVWDPGEMADAIWASALRCAEGVLDLLDQGHFWPPNPRAPFRDFDDYLRPAVEQVIDPSLILPATR